MKKIERPYAIIFIDTEGETLKEDVDNFTTSDIITDYYNSPGFLQWNFYLIVPEEIVGERKNEVESNCTYTRKHVLKSSDIEQFIIERFPEMDETTGKIRLVKAERWDGIKEKVDAVTEEMCNEESNLEEEIEWIESWYRNESLMYALEQMDILRAELIKNPNKRVVFYSHISNEFNIAEKKFKIFEPNYKVKEESL
jgi:hypothetical protein